MDPSLMHSPSLFSLKPTASHWILRGDGRWHKQQNELRTKTPKLRETRQNWKLKRQNKEERVKIVWNLVSVEERVRAYQSFFYWKMWKLVTVREWERGRNVWRGKSKKGSSTDEWKDKKTGVVFLVSWFLHLKS